MQNLQLIDRLSLSSFQGVPLAAPEWGTPLGGKELHGLGLGTNGIRYAAQVW